MSKAPLENVPQERAVLGALISNSQLLWVYKERVPVDLFVLDSHRRITRIMHELIEAGRETTIPAIVARMPEGDQEWSPAGYLATLVADEADPEHLTDNLADLEQMWARRKMMRLGQELMTSATEDSGLDATGRLEQAQAKMGEIHDPTAASVHRIGDIASRVMDATSTAASREQVKGLNVGLKAMQDLLGPLMGGRLYLLPGSSGSGKSALAQQIAEFIAETYPVLFFQLEMDGEEMAERTLARKTNITSDKIERAALNEDEIDQLYGASDDLRSMQLYIDWSTGQTVAQMRAKALRQKRLRGLSLIIVDHVLLIQPADRRKGEIESYSSNLAALKRMAKDLDVPVLALAQLKSSYGEGTWQNIRPPFIGDIYGGSSNEQHPDGILFVYREQYLLERKEPAENDKSRSEYLARTDKVEGTAELILAKRRGGKGAGKRTVFFDADRVTFTDQNPKRGAGRQSRLDLGPANYD